MSQKEKLVNIQRGCHINDQIFSELVKRLQNREFRTEKEVALFINRKIKEWGAKKAFPTIVAIGRNAVDWHHKPTNSRLRKGFCVIDFGARVKGYCSDMTRTVHFGRATKKEKALYKKVLKANLLCIKKVRSGADGNAIYKYAKKILVGHAKYFGHGLGHGLSKKIHDRPRLSRKEGHILKEGNIVTIEPGVYIPRKLGIRIEDDVLVRKNGYRVLSHSTKKLIEIK